MSQEKTQNNPFQLNQNPEEQNFFFKNNQNKNFFAKDSSIQKLQNQGKNASENNTSIFTNNGFKNQNVFQSSQNSVNLFNFNKDNMLNGQGAKKLFDFSSKPAIFKKSESDDESGNEEEVCSTFKTEPDVKIMKYEYKSETIKVKDFDLKIFKNGASPMKEGVYVSIEKVENQPNTLFVIVRNRTTKLSVFKGIVVKKILKMENFLGKKENLRFSILKTEKSKKEEKDDFDLVKDVVKLQFMHEEDCQEFQTIFQKYFGQ